MKNIKNFCFLSGEYGISESQISLKEKPYLGAHINISNQFKTGRFFTNIDIDGIEKKIGKDAGPRFMKTTSFVSDERFSRYGQFGILKDMNIYDFIHEAQLWNLAGNKIRSVIEFFVYTRTKEDDLVVFIKTPNRDVIRDFQREFAVELFDEISIDFFY